MNGVAWPDVIIVAIVLIAVYKGWLQGFIKELAGAVALAAALIAPWYYNGSFDDWLEHTLRLGPGSAHVVGMFLTGLITYVIVLAASWVLNRFAKLPIVNIANSFGGAIVGFAKGAILLWLVLYIALFFPLSPDIRHDLHRSHLAAYLTQPNPNIDHAVLATVPWFAKPFLAPYFNRHRV